MAKAQIVDNILLSDVKTGQYIKIDGKLYTVVKRNQYNYSIIPINIKESKTYNIEASDYKDLNIQAVFDGKTGNTLLYKEVKDATN